MKIENSIRCRIVAQRNAVKEWGETGPEYENILQRSLLVAPADIGKFVVSVVLPGLSQDTFITPNTMADRVFWSFGLDGVDSLEACVHLFDTPADAATSALRFRWQRAAIYEVTLDSDKEGQILLIGRYWAISNDLGAAADFFGSRS